MDNTLAFKHFHLHSDNTLMKYTKVELISYIHVLYHNWKNSDENMLNVMNNADKVLKQYPVKFDTDLLCRAICIYGKISQKQVLIEELAELQKEVCKDLRGFGKQENIIEEIADVLIMLEQLKIMKDISNTDIQKMIDFKTKRLSDEINQFETEQWYCENEERQL